MGKMDGLAIVGFERRAGRLIDPVLKAGIPVVTYSTDNPGSKRTAFARQDLVSPDAKRQAHGQVLDGKGK